MDVNANNKEQEYLAAYLNSEKNFLNRVTSKKGFEIGSRATTSTLGKKIIEEWIKQTPVIYYTGMKKIKNNKIKQVLESELAISL